MKKNKRLLTVLVITCLVFALMIPSFMASCAKPAPAPAPAPTPAPAPAPPKPVTLKFATFDPPQGFVSAAHDTWGKELEKRTQGRYKVEIAWGGAMGAFDAHYDLARTGVADVSYFVASPPLPFPLSETPFLPYLIPDFKTSVTAGWELYKAGYLDKEFAAVKPLFVWTGTGSCLFSKGPITGIADLKGKKVMATSAQAIALLEEMGGVPVQVQLPELYGALEKGVVDAAWLVWVACIPFRLQEVTSYVIEPLFGNPICAVVMNQDSYNKLPEDVKAIVDELSEDVLLPGTIEGYANVDAAGRKVFADAGGKVTTWSEADWAAQEKMLAPFWEQWIAEKEAQGMPARETVDAFWHILKDLGVEKPAIGYTPQK